MAEQNEIKNKIRNDISNNVGDFAEVSRIESFLANNCIENDNINYKKKGQGQKSILEFSLGIGAVEYVNYLLREKSSEIGITQEDFDLAVENGYYYIANKIRSLNDDINCDASLLSKLNKENYKFGKDYFCEKEFELRKKIDNLINVDKIYEIITNINEKIKSENCSDYFKNEINGLISAYSSSNSMSDINKKKFMVKTITKILISSGQEADINVIYGVLGLDSSAKNNNNSNEIKNDVKELRELCSNNYNKIKKLFDDYVFKPVAIDDGNESSNSIGTVQSKMANIFKEDFNSYIIENEDGGRDSLYCRYLKGFTDDKTLNGNGHLFWSEIKALEIMLSDNCSKSSNKFYSLTINDNKLGKDYGHFILNFNNEYLDDSMGKEYKDNGVQVDNCCGVYATHMEYIAERIYDLMNINGTVDDNKFRKTYKKFREIYVKNANKDGNKNKMREINCKNRLCIAALNSLQMLEKNIGEDKYKELENKIKNEIENSFITEEMKKKFKDLEDYAKKEKIKIEKEKISFKKKYIESFSSKISSNKESFSSKISSNKENINRTVENIRNEYYNKKIAKINNLKKSINDTYNSGENCNKNNIEDLINRGEISNEKIIRSICNKGINKLSKELQESVLPVINIDDKNYSGFGGKASYDDNNKTLTVNYDSNGFFCDKLDSIDGVDDAIKNNLKKSLKIELKDGCGNEKLIEIFSLLKTNPVLALIELKDISEKIYIGDTEILNDNKNFNNLVNVFGIISESRRQTVKLNNSKEVNNNNKDYAKIKNYICDTLTKALMDNKIAKQIIDLTEFKDINIITGQFLDLFKEIEAGNKNLIDKFSEEAKNMKGVLENNNISNEEKDKLMIGSFMKHFNIFINHKLDEMKKRISDIENRLKKSNEKINNV